MSQINTSPDVKHIIAKGGNRTLCGLTGIARSRLNHITVCAWKYVDCTSCLEFCPDNKLEEE